MLGPITSANFPSHMYFQINDLATASLSNNEYILDVPFILEEVECAIRKLKSGKSGGPDGLSAEHLKWGGDSLHL